jgi:polyhydroxybutyrate depolymerase
MRRTGRLSRALGAVVLFVSVAAVSGASPGGGAVALEGCGLDATGGTLERSVGDRVYDLHVPQGLSGPSVPLVLSLHGYGEPRPQHERETGWPAFAAGHGFIVAFPQGVARRWDFAAGSADVAWLREVVADVSATWCVDPSRVYAEGYSNGAMMVERLACDAADVFAAVAAYAGASPSAMGGGACEPSRPIAVGIFQSLLDPISSYPVGVANRDEWVSRNACPSGAAEEGVIAEAIRYAPCQSGVEVVWRVYAAQSHNWPTGPDGADIATRIWQLFDRNRRL